MTLLFNVCVLMFLAAVAGWAVGWLFHSKRATTRAYNKGREDMRALFLNRAIDDATPEQTENLLRKVMGSEAWDDTLDARLDSYPLFDEGDR